MFWFVKYICEGNVFLLFMEMCFRSDISLKLCLIVIIIRSRVQMSYFVDIFAKGAVRFFCLFAVSSVVVFWHSWMGEGIGWRRLCEKGFVNILIIFTVHSNYVKATSPPHLFFHLLPCEMNLHHFPVSLSLLTGSSEVTHWTRMLESQRSPVAQWHTIKTREECDKVYASLKPNS